MCNSSLIAPGRTSMRRMLPLHLGHGCVVMHCSDPDETFGSVHDFPLALRDRFIGGIMRLLREPS